MGRPGLETLRASCALLLILTPGASRASDSAEHDHAGVHHHVALFIGGGIETKPGHDDHDTGLATGLEYEARFRPRWGVGGVLELLGQTEARDVVLVVPVSFHPAGGLLLFAGPGVEFTPKKKKYVTRLGLGYEFPLNEHWDLAPEGVADFIEGGAITWLLGAAIGYGF